MCASESAQNSEAALAHCSYGTWHAQYAALSPASRVIQLDQEAADFLQEDGLVLHEESAALPQRSKPGDIIVEGVDYDPEDLYSTDSSSSSSTHDADSDTGSSDSERDTRPWSQRFPALHAAVATAISELGGAVAPRLNWSSPTDALWLTSSNSLRCTNPDEVLLLLKGSDRVAHDLEQLQQIHSRQPQQQQQQQQPTSSLAAGSGGCSSSSQPLPTQLVLRSWCTLQPEWQFRVFVCGHNIAAISQRDPSQHFPQLASAADAEGGQHSLRSIQQRVVDFHTAHIGSSVPLDSYAMDVYVPARGSVKLLDLSPICPTTSPLCFDWEDLPYQHMKQQHDQQHSIPEQQQQQQQQQHGDGVSNSSSSGSSSSRGGQCGIQFCVVEHEGMIVPGSHVATGMPYDMLGLPDAVSEVMAAMQQQQLQQ